ncbi:Ig-like domain-containing protein [Candidatus Uhrbacteria bacterium]|nr:Ig-like domain-containing protein [Candidatus Uhrbacteria bacterium]
MNLPRRSSVLGMSLALLISVGIFVASPVLAVDTESFAAQAGFTTTADVTVIITRLIRTAISFIGVIAVAFVLYGGFMFMTAGGNAERVKSAKKILLNALIGLILVFASFAIVSFILNALSTATGATITSQESGSSSYSDSASSAQFYLRSVNTDCAEALQNLELQFIFSKSVDASTVEDGIVVTESGAAAALEGTFEVSGKTVTFTPTQACGSPYEAYSCFDASSDYTIEIDSTVVESSSGSSLVCSTSYPCSFEFTTGTGVDVEGPTVSMDAPEDGESLYQGSIELLQATTTDDTGVSSVDFYVIDDDEAIYSSGVELSTMGELTGGGTQNAFYTDTAQEWDTSGYTTNERYNIWASGSDCAGNDDTATSVEIVLRAANCNNEVQDEDLGETDVDCGGDSDSAYYCGACTGDSCEESADCSSGQCVDGVCVETPKIESVSAGDGAVGNLITISGEAFGDNEGTVTFLGTESGDEVTAAAYSCNDETQWSDTQIIVQVPTLAVDGPISVTTTDTTQDPDRTDDDYGPSIADFDVNAIERPGICQLDPDSGQSETAVDVYGNSFGQEQGSSTFYFTNYEASSYAHWDTDGEFFTVGVPNVNAGTYWGQVFTGDDVCLDESGDPTGATCSKDADCDTDAGETCATSWCSQSLDYCSSDEDCGDTGGDCDSIRAGSNKVAFTVEDTSSGTTPVISSIDTGWSACSGGTDDGEHCGDDSDCESGVCADQSTWGPPGQYVTIYGTNFGTAEGSVFLENQTTGATALADTEFPDACGEDFWHDTSITVKIPETYQTDDAIEYVRHSLYLERQDGVSSDATDLEVLDDAPGPSVCDMDPGAGPVGTEVTIYGENFGDDDGDVQFYSGQSAAYTLWENDQVSSVIVPDAAATGPVYVIEATSGYASNSLNFEVGDCNEDASLCQDGETCCTDGSCTSSTCAEEEVTEAHYAFKVSTGTTPDTPEVVISCDSTISSPAPWEGWSDPENICINSQVHADFDMTMDQSTLSGANIVVEKCAAFFTAAEQTAGDGTQGDCKTWEAVSVSSIDTSTTGFSWTPSGGYFEASTSYRVTLNGSGEAGAIQADESEGGGYLDGDYRWEFTTSSSTDLCEVGGVNVSPVRESVEEAGDVDYLASLVSADDQCVTLSCSGYVLDWDSDFDGAVIDDSEPGESICTNVVDAQSETAAGDPAIITATVTDSEGEPSGEGELTINFTDPEVDDYFPDCSTACVNALPWAEFNTEMDVTTIDTSTVTMYECEDSLCAESEITPVDFVSSIDYILSTQRMEVLFDTGEAMTSDTWYRIVLDGDAILAANGNQLSESGSNYGDDANRYFKNDFSWTFQTKDSDVTCDVDSVTVSPDETTATYVGDRAQFDATAYGAPDECSVDGQALQSSSYTWSAWGARDVANLVGDATGSSSDQSDIVAYMIQGGEIELTSDLPAYCSASCLNIGAPVTTSDGVCGNGTVETYEECDDGDTVDGDGCSSACLDEGTTACTSSAAGSCCGNGTRDWSSSLGGEDCDDGNSKSGDGCSSSCLNEGSRSISSSCGDATRDWAEGTGGEDCDDDNAVSGDGCSSNCLKEGSLPLEDAYAICGNGGSPETGEDCDDGNIVDGDGCSSACLHEGTSACASSSSNNCCGNSKVEIGEDCDGGSAGEDGCSDRCLYEGSSYLYTTPSFCGDGDATGSGEECDAQSSSTFAVGDYSVGQIAQGAPQEVSDGYAISTITASVEGESDSATYQLECSCTTDYSCGDATTLGCGTSNCCFERPELGEIYPADNTASPGDGYCRNTAIWAEFTLPMDDTTFDGNLYLDLVSIDGNEVSDASQCPDGYTTTTVEADAGASTPLARAWQWVKSFVLGVFGIEAQASGAFGCLLPVSYETQTDSAGTTQQVSLRYNSLLESGGVYRLVVEGDDDSLDTAFDGVLSENGAALCLGSGCTSSQSVQSFYVGDEICALDSLLVEDQGMVDPEEYEDVSAEFFSATGEEHSFTVTPLTLRDSGAYEQISEITGIYEWSYAWSSSVDDTDEDDVVALVDGTGGDSTTASYTSSGTTGEESVIATATITVDELNPTSTVDDTTTGLLTVTSVVCENPWPALDSTTLDFPYVEDVTPSYFSFYYCRDAGEAGTDDDLPALDDPIDVNSLSSSGIIQELIFKVADSSDAIGVRVAPNPDYDSPSAWVEAQAFTGSFTETTLDGYRAVESGTTLYAAAANQNGTTIYPNIYIVSYNENAGEDAADIFSQILENWKFNANDDVVTDVNLCSDGTDLVTTSTGEYLDCSWDGDCVETCESGVCSLTGDACTTDADCDLPSGTGVCDAEKAKLTRDMQRLTDVTDTIDQLQTFGEANAHCEVTTDTSCETDDDCPGTEECLLGFPDVQSGTFVPALTNSAWGSWNSAFANELGDTPPTDPTNEFYDCNKEGYDSASCWDGEAGTFICPDNSHIYGYQSLGGIAYTLYTQMETAGNVAWAYDIDGSSTDEATVVAEYPTGNAPSTTLQNGFVSSAQFCDGGTWGDSVICGDGTQGPTEVCEIGDTQTITGCTDSTGSAGVISSACLSDCSGYQSVAQAQTAGAECVPYSCGNGVIETGETCDDGSLNGTYGYCDDNCSYADAYLCGDGYLAGTEQCDCAKTGLYNYSDALADDTSSWAYLNGCDVSNGQYSSDINVSCAYDCTQPGLSCGDGTVNGAEECDGDYEEWEGALCSDGTECTSDSDCDTGTCGAGGSACGTGDVCTDYDDAGEECTKNSECDSGSCSGGECTSASDAGDVCTTDAQCDSGSCPDFNYSLYRYRSCESDCSWPASWSACVGGTQICGNGSVEGAEECDDGNSSNNDDCLNTCVENTCGDDYVESGVESCDDGQDNGDVCDADYEDTCNYCNAQCQYKTRSGGYCGDEIVNGSEVCDGSYSTEFKWFDAGTQATQGSCDTHADSETVDSVGYTCRWLGVCNGGDENGDYCTLDYSTYASSGTVKNLSSGTDVNTCTGGECVAPVCADDCGSSCPTSFETTGLLVKSELSASDLVDTISLYSYGNEDGLSPDAASLSIPACTAGTSITATVDDSDVTPPDVDIVFVTDLTSSMNDPVSGSTAGECSDDGSSCDKDDDCSSSATCEPEIGSRKIDFVVDATTDAIKNLFDAYNGTDSTIQIALVSYTTAFRTASFCNSNTAQTDGAWTDFSLVGKEKESDLLTSVETYATCVDFNSGSTPTYNALKEADAILDTSEADVQIMVILTDGDYDWNHTFVESSGDEDESEECLSSFSKSYNGNTYTAKPACAAEMYDDFVDASPYYFYTAAITSSSTYQGYTAHISSDDCAWATSSSASSTSDCTGNYAFTATDADEIDTMYDAIVDSILGTVVTLTATDASGDTTSTSGEIQPGENVTLPFPDGFVCDSSEQAIPLRNTFFGSGAMSFSDFEFTYCPYE